MWWKNNTAVWAIVFAMLGVMVPWWPLSVMGVLLAAITDRALLAIVLGVVLDLIWGQPTGFLSHVFFPMTLMAVIASCLRLLSLRYMLSKMPERL